MKNVLLMCAVLCSIQLSAQIVEVFSYPTTSNLRLMHLVDLETAGQKWMHKIMLEPEASSSDLFCDTPSPNPGFPDLPECEAVVCASDNFCCDNSWDAVCAASATTFPECAACLSTGSPSLSTRKIQLLNLDYTLFIEIDCSSFPNSSPTYSFFTAIYFSQHLFDDDDDIEFLFSYMGAPIANSYTGIYNQDGSLVAAFPGAHTSLNVSSSALEQSRPIFNTTEGAVMQLVYQEEIKFYALPGMLYDPCCNADNPGIPTHNPAPLPARGMSSAFPNPTYGAVTIDYELPVGVTAADLLIINSAGQTVKTYRISSVVNRVNLDLSNLSPGNYFYQIESGQNPITAKKLIKH